MSMLLYNNLVPVRVNKTGSPIRLRCVFSHPRLVTAFFYELPMRYPVKKTSSPPTIT